MRTTITTFLLLLSMSLFTGCKDQDRTATKHEHLTPTWEESKVLDVHGLDPNSETGQAKLRRMRDRQAKLDAARERMESYAKEAEEHEAEEAGE